MLFAAADQGSWRIRGKVQLPAAAGVVVPAEGAAWPSNEHPCLNNSSSSFQHIEVGEVLSIDPRAHASCLSPMDIHIVEIKSHH